MWKLAVVTLLALAINKVAGSSEELKIFAKVSKDCFDENQVTEEEFKNFYMNGMKPEAATQHIKCHIKCIMEKLKHLKSGVLDVNAALKTFEDIPEFRNYLEAMRKGYEVCKNEKGADDCETAYKISMCLQKFDAGDNLEV